MGGTVVRASDADRERTLRSLRAHYTAGRLEADELEERIGAATRAQSRADLRALTFDLPRDARGRGARAVARVDAAVLRLHGAAFAGVNGAVIGAWALTGGGEFWPAFLLLPWGVGLGAHAYGSRALRRALGAQRRRERPRMVHR
jgi:hypothetical protein